MINYTEKGSTLHTAIQKAGHSLREENGVWISSDDEAVQAIIDGYTLAQAQAAKKAEVNALAKQLRDKAIAAVSPGEMASWPIKLSEAAAFAAGGTNTPMLAAEAAIRGITVAQIVAKVGGNSTTFAALEAQIGGNDGRHRDLIDALATFEEVNGYDYSAGWPEI
jgi:hypothetical protein